MAGFHGTSSNGCHIAAVIALMAAFAVQSQEILAQGTENKAAIQGDWNTPDKATIRIAPCGNDLCGSIIDFTPPPDMTRDDARDVFNPDRTKRARKVLGLTILSELKQNGEGWTGTIYDPKRGYTADATALLKGRNRLRMKGCIRILFFKQVCETQTWRRPNS